jgi:two-component system chemotaxis response regulator CheB
LGALRRGLEGSAHGFRAVGIGASTGGPSALKSVLAELRANFPAPILVVQHIAPGFVEGFVAWLRDATPLPVRLAVDGERLAPATVYVAPDGAHLGVSRDERIALVTPRERAPICPAATFLFESLADVFGPQAIGVLLTGMGRDGADGLLKMKRAGAITIVQDKETSVVHGMPAEAIALGAADFVLPPSRIGELLMTFASAAYPMVK